MVALRRARPRRVYAVIRALDDKVLSLKGKQPMGGAGAVDPPNVAKLQGATDALEKQQNDAAVARCTVRTGLRQSFTISTPSFGAGEFSPIIDGDMQSEG